MNKNVYRSEVLKVPNVGENTDTVNLSDDHPELLFGLDVDGNPEEGGVPPFLLDSSASHNLMPKIVKGKLGLEIGRPYKYLYYFDSNKVRCVGLIKDLCVTLA